MLSVFLNLDPTEFATPGARSSAITSVMTARRTRSRRPTGSRTTSAWRCATTSSAYATCSCESDVAANGTRAVAVYACGPTDLLEVVAPAPPGREQGRARPHARSSSRSSLHGTDERWMVLLANRRAARLFFGPGDALEETDRIVDDVHPSTSRAAGRSSTTSARSRRRSTTTSHNAAELAFDLYKQRGARPRPGRRARRAARASSRASCTRTCASGSPADPASTSRTRRWTTSAPRRGR